MVVAPVRFETIARAMNVELAIVEAWAKEEGFPVAGVGVALLAEVQKWRSGAIALPETHGQPEVISGCPSGETSGPESPVVDDDSAGHPEGVQWVTIRVPLLMSGATLPGINPVQSLRIRGRERHIRDVWGKLIHGCRAEHVRLSDGKAVVGSSETLKYIFERIADAADQG